MLQRRGMAVVTAWLDPMAASAHPDGEHDIRQRAPAIWLREGHPERCHDARCLQAERDRAAASGQSQGWG